MEDYEAEATELLETYGMFSLDLQCRIVEHTPMIDFLMKFIVIGGFLSLGHLGCHSELIVRRSGYREVLSSAPVHTQ